MHSSFPLNGPITRRGFLRRNARAVALGWAGASAAFGQQPSARTTVNDELGRAMSKAELSMQFRGESAAECRAWQTAFRAKLKELLGDSMPPKKWSIVEEDRATLEDHVRYQLLLTAEGVSSVPVYLLVPAGLKEGERAPGVLWCARLSLVDLFS